MTGLSPASRDRTGTHIPAPDFEAGVSTQFHHSGIIVGTEGFEPITYKRTLRPERSAATSYATCRKIIYISHRNFMTLYKTASAT